MTPLNRLTGRLTRILIQIQIEMISQKELNSYNLILIPRIKEKNSKPRRNPKFESLSSKSWFNKKTQLCRYANSHSLPKSVDRSLGLRLTVA